MGKIRVAALGDEKSEKEQKRRAEARRETKKSKKQKVEGVGLHGGERVAMVEGTEIKPEFRDLVEKAESGEEGKQAKKKVIHKTEKSRSSKYLKARSMVDRKKLYPITEAVELVKKTSISRFTGSVEAHINLKIAAGTGKKAEKKDIRGSVNLPHGTGKKIRVAVADEALISEISAGKINFDVLVANPAMMPKLARVAKILGPRGLMPNPKTGTVTDNVEKKVAELSAGQINYKSEPGNPIIHLTVGKTDFETKQIIENITALADAIGRTRIFRLTLASTMGPGVKVDPVSF